MRGIPVAEAVARVTGSIAAVDAESVPLRESLGLVLAEDVRADAPLPRWANSSMDGYAVRVADVAGASRENPRTLHVIGVARAGGAGGPSVGEGHAVRIMTGAPLPPGAECVVRVEDTDGGEHQARVFNDRDAGQNVRPAGQDVAEGAVAVGAGTRIGAAQLALLAAVGCATVPVRRRPRVAILCSGDELVMAEELAGGALPEDCIVSANSYALEALVVANGSAPLQLGIVADDPLKMRERIEQCAACDLLVTSGGVSMGAHDFTRGVMEAMGATDSFWRVAMRPGGPFAFGRLGEIPWLALPGNPVSAMVTFELFARPVIRMLSGDARPFRVPQPVESEETITTRAPLTHFHRATVTVHGDGRRTARLTGHQGSGLLTSMTHADALLVVGADRERVEAGEILPALMLHDESQQTDSFRL
jgi:molybdopterin molybdotransferase